MIIFILGVYFFQSANKKKNEELIGNIDNKSINTISENSINDFKKEISVNPCLYFKKQYENIDLIKKEKHSQRFLNIHKRIDGEVYRLRIFFKETNEGEKMVFLVYKEDIGEIEHIIEKSDYKRGKLFKKVEAEAGDIIFRDEAITLGDEENLFLHFVNNKIKSIQGRPLEFSSTKELNCQFNN